MIGNRLLFEIQTSDCEHSVKQTQEDAHYKYPILSISPRIYAPPYLFSSLIDPVYACSSSLYGQLRHQQFWRRREARLQRDGHAAVQRHGRVESSSETRKRYVALELKKQISRTQQIFPIVRLHIEHLNHLQGSSQPVATII